MSVTNHERPGVYSRYDASTVVKGRGGGGCVGLAALCGTGTAGTLYTFNRYEEAVTAFGGEETLTELVRLLFLNGAAQVKAVPVAEEAGYKAALRAQEAASAGAEKTINMKARTGRSGYLGDRTIGQKDPGAAAIVLILQSFTSYIV